MPSARSYRRCPIAEMHRVLDNPPQVEALPLRAGARLTTPWTHGALHGPVGPMGEHVVMTYYGAPRTIAYRQGAREQRSLTREGAITLIPAGEAGHWDIDGEITVSHVYLPPERLALIADEIRGGPGLTARVAHEDRVASSLLRVISIAAEDDPDPLFLDQALDLLCLRLLRTHGDASETRPRARGGLPPRTLKRLTQYMDAHLHREIRLEELAAIAHLSRFHFCAAFRQATGRPPFQWLRERRIKRSQALLANPGLPVTQIALAVGYETPAAFSRAFRKVTGLTPSEWRGRL